MIKNYGLVLGGGGAKGAYQIGVWKAIDEFKNFININFISGSSIGALNSVLFLSKEQSESEKIWKELNGIEFFELKDNISDGLCKRDSLILFLKNKIDFEKISNSKTPLFVSICDSNNNVNYFLLNGKKEEDIIDLLLATSAMPIIYDMVEYKGIKYQDGGVGDNLPITPLYNNNINNLIVVPLSMYSNYDYSVYKNSKIIEIKPTLDLKGLFLGTLNFSKEEINLRISLGYMDAKRTLNEHFGIDNGIHTPEYDNENILREYRTQKIIKNINKNMDYIKKYDI